MSHRPLVTFDSNVLVYTAQAGDARRIAALELLRMAARGRCCVLTVQALGEFFFAATRKGYLSRPIAAAQVRRWMTVFPSPAATSATAVVAAMDAAAEGRFSYWDALLLATAAEAGCAAAISEDMAEGAALGCVRVVPAFARGAVNAAARALL